MKQQILNLKKKLLIVELPEGAYNVKVRFSKFLTLFKPYSKVVERFDDFDIKLIGKPTDLTEEQFKECVEVKYDGVPFWFFNAEESFFSSLESQGIYFKNPYGKYKPTRKAESDGTLQTLNWQQERWQEVEQKVWNRDNTYLFEII
jgi:hypothetical protein